MKSQSFVRTPDDSMTLESGCEMVDATSGHRPDTGWRFTDSAGHLHQWHTDGQPAGHYSAQKSYEVPTLQYIVDETGADIYGEERVIAHNECKKCGEHVSPGFTADTFTQMVPGLRWYKINGVNVSLEEYKAAIESNRQKWSRGSGHQPT